MARARSRSRPTCSRVISSSAWPSTISPKWPATTAEASRIAAAGQLGDLAAVGVDPDGRLAGDRVDAVAAVGAGDQPGRRHGQEPAGVGDPLPHHGPPDLEPVFVRAQARSRRGSGPAARSGPGRGPPGGGPSGAGRAGRRPASGRPARSGDSRSPARAGRRAAGPPSAPRAARPRGGARPRRGGSCRRRVARPRPSGAAGPGRPAGPRPRPAPRRASSSGTFGSAVNASRTRKPAADGQHARGGRRAARSRRGRGRSRTTTGSRSGPAASEIRNAGTWLTRPSPIVSLVKTLTASPSAHAVLDDAEEQPGGDVDQR